MPITDARSLRCWQLADAVRAEVIAICASKPIAADFRFSEDFRAAAGSVCHNISEGFARYESAEIVRFFRYALGSLAEVQDYVIECGARGAIEKDECDRLIDRCQHTRATTLKFMKPHLQRTAPSSRAPRKTSRR
jgi:four helix bundle protein